MRQPSLILAIVTCLALTPGSVAQAVAVQDEAGPDAKQSPTLEERLEELATKLEEQRETLHIPGMAIAIVHDDEIIFARGFGLADVEEGTPVTEETRFAAGSTTKAFTATLIGMLVDEGRMGWDEPVRTYLPDFVLTDPVANEGVVVRDLLCHRIGFASMNLLWYGNEVNRQEILQTAVKAQLLYPFREKFNYCNISFLAAGEAAGAVAESDWDTLMRQRIFEPLGMRSANTTYGAAQADALMAKGYRWEEEVQELVHQPMKRIDSVAPAGAINASVLDMAQWIRFQLGRGEFEGRRLLSREQHTQTWTPHIQITDGIEYGLGWFIREWRGQEVIEHAGGIDGYTAEVAMLPEEQLGFVLLMNLFGSPLQETSRPMVFEAVLDEGVSREGDSEDFSEFVGTYIGDFAHFDEAEFEVLVQNGHLAVDVPGQMVFELTSPDESGRRAFVIADAIEVEFSRNEAEDVVSMTIHQAGLSFELPRQGIEVAAEIEIDEARPYLGLYHDARLGSDVEVVIRKGRLAVDVPSQMVYELHLPDEQDRWVFRVRDSLWVRFNRDEAGSVTSMTMSEEEVETELPRVGEPAQQDLPTVEEVMALVHAALGAARIDAPAEYRARGKVSMLHMGLEGVIEATMSADGAMSETMDFGKFGRITTRLTEEGAWIEASFMPTQELHGAWLEQVRLEHPLLVLGDWRSSFEKVGVRKRGSFDGVDVYEVKLEPSEAPPVVMYVDVDSGFPVGRELQMIGPMETRIGTTVRMSEYAEAGGVMIAHRVEIENPLTGTMVMVYEDVEAREIGR